MSLRKWITGFGGTVLRLCAVGILALSPLSGSASAQDSFTAALDSVVRSVCMNDGMKFDDRYRTLSALGWEPAGDMAEFQLFADLEARAYLLGKPETESEDLPEALAVAAKTFQKMIARRLGAPEDSLDRVVFLQSAALPGLTLELVKFSAGDQMTVDICRFASASPPVEFVQYVEDAFILAPAKQNAIGRHRTMFFNVSSKTEKTWTLELTERALDDGSEGAPMLLSINTRVRKD